MRMIAEQHGDYPNPTALAKGIAGRERIGVETVRRWIVQADVDSGVRPGTSSDGQAEIKPLKAKVLLLEEDNAILKAAS